MVSNEVVVGGSVEDYDGSVHVINSTICEAKTKLSEVPDRYRVEIVLVELGKEEVSHGCTTVTIVVILVEREISTTVVSLNPEVSNGSMEVTVLRLESTQTVPEVGHLITATVRDSTTLDDFIVSILYVVDSIKILCTAAEAKQFYGIKPFYPINHWIIINGFTNYFTDKTNVCYYCTLVLLSQKTTLLWIF